MLFKYFGFLLLIIVASVSAQEAEEEEEISHKNSAEYPELFFIAKGKGLWQVITDESGNYKAERRTKNAEKALAVDYHYARDLLVWSTWDGGFYVSTLSGLREDGYLNRIYSNREWYSVSIAVDFLSNIIYVIEAKTNTLQTLTIEGEYLTNLIRSFDPILADGYKPRQIEVDPFEGYLFLLDDVNDFSHIYRMKLDASDIQRIDPESFTFQKRIGGITLDIYNKKILAASLDDNAVYAMNYDGKNVNEVTKANNYGYSMSTTKAYLYGVNVTSYTSDPLCDKTEIISTSVYRCDYANLKMSVESCRQLSTNDWGAVLQVKAVNPEIQRMPDGFFNPCSYENRKCAEVCINEPLREDRKFTCRCKPGRRLVNNSFSCEDFINEFMVYENDDIVGGIDLDDVDPKLERLDNEVFPPFKIQLKRTPGEQYGFDFDSRIRNVYYSNQHSIIKRNFGHFNSYPVVSEPLKNYGLVAMDWLTQNLYFVEMSREAGSRRLSYAIGVSTIPASPWETWDGPGKRRTSAFVKKLRRDVGKVQSLLVHPRRGFVFYAALDEAKQRYEVSRMNTDGSSLLTLSELGEVLYVAADYEADKLYYISDSCYIYRANLDGRAIEKVTELPASKNLSLDFINGFAVNGNWIYVKSTEKIIRYEKDSSNSSWMNFDPYPFNNNMKTQIRFNINELGEFNSCDYFNGGCKQICFSLPTEGGQEKWNTVCGCDDDYKLNSDGKTCDRL